MGWSVIGRIGWCSLLALIVSTAAAAGCASSRSGMSPQQTSELRAVLRNVYEAVERGDESEYRRLVTIRTGDEYSHAVTDTMFASIKLHQVVDKKIRNNISDDPHAATLPASTRPSSRHMPATTEIRASLAAVDYRDNARTILRAIESWTFTVRGDHATIDQLASRPGAPTRRRDGKHWVLEPLPLDLPRGTASYRLAVAQERDMTTALTMAHDAVMSGEARSIEDVNTILRKLLTPPTTQP
jgi:hypothetical protein